jgi:hypothetical protein
LRAIKGFSARAFEHSFRVPAYPPSSNKEIRRSTDLRNVFRHMPVRPHAASCAESKDRAEVAPCKVGLG